LRARPDRRHARRSVDLLVEEDLFLVLSLSHDPPDLDDLTSIPPEVLRIPRDGR
jgi:hypothetical protein